MQSVSFHCLREVCSRLERFNSWLRLRDFDGVASRLPPSPLLSLENSRYLFRSFGTTRKPLSRNPSDSPPRHSIHRRKPPPHLPRLFLRLKHPLEARDSFLESTRRLLRNLTGAPLCLCPFIAHKANPIISPALSLATTAPPTLLTTTSTSRMPFQKLPFELKAEIARQVDVNDRQFGEWLNLDKEVSLRPARVDDETWIKGVEKLSMVNREMRLACLPLLFDVCFRLSPRSVLLLSDLSCSLSSSMTTLASPTSLHFPPSPSPRSAAPSPSFSSPTLRTPAIPSTPPSPPFSISPPVRAQV